MTLFLTCFSMASYLAELSLGNCYVFILFYFALRTGQDPAVPSKGWQTIYSTVASVVKLGGNVNSHKKFWHSKELALTLGSKIDLSRYYPSHISSSLWGYTTKFLLIVLVSALSSNNGGQQWDLAGSSTVKPEWIISLASTYPTYILCMSLSILHYIFTIYLLFNTH